MDSPYAAAADDYYSAGFFPIPLPPGEKFPPPTGATGTLGSRPNPDLIEGWKRQHGAGNIAVRLSSTVLGLDVDAYDTSKGLKQGKASLDALVERLGPLPKTWRSTSRDDGVSGISLYKVPERPGWKGIAGDGIEVIQSKHRYALVWPSVHPKTGKTYRWIDPEGMTVLGAGPALADLPELPETWVEELATDHTLVKDENGQPSDFLSTGEACTKVRDLLTRAILSLGSDSRHDHTRNNVLAMLRLAQVGHPGVEDAMLTLRKQFVDAISDRTDTQKAIHEFNSMVRGAAQIVAADKWPKETCNGTVCTTQAAEKAMHPSYTPKVVAEEKFGASDLSFMLGDQRPKLPEPGLLERSDGVSMFYFSALNGLYGPPETGKSWVALQACAEILAAGEPAAYIDADHNGEVTIAGRLLALGVPAEIIADPNQFRMYRPEGPEDFMVAIAEIVEERYSVVVLDSLGEAIPAFGLNSNSADDFTTFNRGVLLPLKNSGAAVIVIDHVSKGEGAISSGYASGTHAKKRPVDGVYVRCSTVAELAPGKIGMLDLFVEKDRNGNVRRHTSDKKFGRFILDSRAAEIDCRLIPASLEANEPNPDFEYEPTNLMERVSIYLESRPWGATKNQLTANVPGLMTEGAIRSLEKRGFVRVEEGLYYSAVKFREVLGTV